MVAVLPVVVVAPASFPPAPVLVATLAPVVPSVLELVEAALAELEVAPADVVLADVDVALEPFVPVTALPDVAAVADVCPDVPPALVLPLSAPESAAPFEPSLQAETTTVANVTSKPKRRDFIGDAPRAKINHAVAGSTIRHRAQRFRCFATRTRQKSGAHWGPQTWKVFSRAPMRSRCRSVGRSICRRPESPLSGDVSRGRPKDRAALSA